MLILYLHYDIIGSVTSMWPCLLVCWWVSRSYHKFRKGRKVTLPCCYRSTCLSLLLFAVVSVYSGLFVVSFAVIVADLVIFVVENIVFVFIVVFAWFSYEWIFRVQKWDHYEIRNNFKLPWRCGRVWRSQMTDGPMKEWGWGRLLWCYSIYKRKVSEELISLL